MDRSTRFLMALSVALAPTLLGTDGCSEPTGDPRLSVLELQVDGKNRLAGFDPDGRFFDVWVPDEHDTVTLEVQAVESSANLDISVLGVTESLGVGSGVATVTLQPGMTPIVVLIETAGGKAGTYVLYTTRAPAPPPCYEGFAQSEVVTVGCVWSGSPPRQWSGPFELSVQTGAITAGEAFEAELDGVAIFDEFFLDIIQGIPFGGTQRVELVDVVATVQVRSGATGPDVPLTVDVPALVPGPTRFCMFPDDQTCSADSECLVPPCRPPVNLVDLPISTDGPTCMALGAPKDQQFSSRGFCITGPLRIPLAAQTAIYTADLAGGRVLWGWADQGVPGLVLCPDAGEARCASNGGAIPDGTYALPLVMFNDPAAPIGIRVNANNANFIADQCAMATQSVDAMGFPLLNVVEPTPDADLIACTSHLPQCLIDADCAVGERCVSHTPVSCSAGGGVCETIPGSCDLTVDPVCGCDGVTYSNHCNALVAGVRASALGACDCNTNADCAASEYCNALTCDGPGVCSPRPTSCTGESGLATGCDSASYDSVCAAAAAGVRVGGQLYPPSPF